MNRIIGFIPHLFTLGNLLCGCLAIKFAFEWDLVMAALLVGIAAVLDFFDGFLARLLKVSGELGKQLDSLADVVSFGVVPGVVMFQTLKLSIYIDQNFNGFGMPGNIEWMAYIAFLIPLFSAFRLAKFNIDTRPSDKFYGLPTPANAIFLCSIGMLTFFGNQLNEVAKNVFLENSSESYNFTYYVNFHKEDINFFQEMFLNPYALTGIVLIFSLLLVSNLPLFALKFKNFGWADNKIRYIFVLISVALLIFLQLVAIPIIILLYIVLSVLNNYIFKL